MAYRIDLTPNASYTETVSVSQDDVGREVVVDLYLDGVAYTPTTGTTIVMQGTKPSSLGYTITGTASGSTVTFLTTEEMTQEAGRFASEIVLTNGMTVIGTANFALYVEKNPHPANSTDGTLETIPALEERIEALEQGGGGLTDDIKQALLQIASKVAYIDEHGQDYYDDLYDALYAVTAVNVSPTTLNFSTLGSTQQLTASTTPSGASVTWTSSNTAVATVDSTGLVTSVGYGSATITATAGQLLATCAVVVAQATVTSIDAVYTQSGTVYDTDSLDSLKDDLVVTAHWSNGTTSTVASADYTLSGTLAEGTSIVTVSYGGKTATFDVTVTKAPSYVLDDLELWLDATKYKPEGITAYASIVDKSGNNVALTFGNPYQNHIVFADTFISQVTRASIKVDSSDFVAKLMSGFTIEVVFQNRYYADGDTSAPRDGGSTNKIASFVNGRGVINSNAQIQLLTANTYYGTAVDLTSAIHTVSITYDGTTLKEYVDGVETYSAAQSINLTSVTFLEFFGSQAYSQNAPCSWNAVRVYSNVLSADSITENRQMDVATYGTVNIESA